MLRFEPIQPQLLSNEQAMLYLGLTKRSTLDHLVRKGRVTPIRIAKANLYARSELDALVERELKKEKRLRDNNPGDTS